MPAVGHGRDLGGVDLQRLDKFGIVAFLGDDDRVVGQLDLRPDRARALEEDVERGRLDEDLRVAAILHPRDHARDVADERLHHHRVARAGHGADAVRQVLDLPEDLVEMVEHHHHLGAFLGRGVEAPQSRHRDLVMHHHPARAMPVHAAAALRLGDGGACGDKERRGKDGEAGGAVLLGKGSILLGKVGACLPGFP
jgi:hypothetical protein